MPSHCRDGRHASGSGEQYSTDPQWSDTTSQIYLFKAGADEDSVFAPDFRAQDAGNSDNTGYDYSNIYNGIDFTGRSLYYDIRGVERTHNDVGALSNESGN